ncbi:GDSL-type esterase/lipase family protein [Streptomyces sp. NPDC050610]|uniref:GDSL-type esterase/lipase family protein n=1 Tax=Streptomyces sp. NPDC050610 TaxID=3157097 RepID=UPI0034393B2B
MTTRSARRRPVRKALSRLWTAAVLARGEEPGRQSEVACSGTYGDDPGEPLRLVLLGDSAALSIGVERRSETVGSVLATALSKAAARRVELRVLARFGALSGSLSRQVDRMMLAHPGVAVVAIGTSDVLAPVRTRTAARHLEAELRRLTDAGWSVTIATCPYVRQQPAVRRWARSLTARRSRRLARAQTHAALRCGAQSVSLFDHHLDLGDGLLCADGLHPSAQGYALHLRRLAPAVQATARLAAESGRPRPPEHRAMPEPRRSADGPVSPGAAWPHDREVPLRTAAAAAVIIPGLQCAPGRPGRAVVRLTDVPLPLSP